MQVLEQPTSTDPTSLQPWEVTGALAAEEYADIVPPELPETVALPQGAQPTEANSVLTIVLPKEVHPIPGTVELSGRIRLEKEEFRFEWDDDQVRILHDQWSLCGFGKTLLDAQLDFISEARELGSVMANMDPTDLTEEASRLRTFSLRFLTATPSFSATLL